jgi:arginine utilization protein RocB
VAFLANVLLTDASPEDVVVRKVLPTLRDLGSTAERSRIKVAENLETNFTGEDGKRVYANEVGELLSEKGKLGEATHGEETLENESTTGMGR